MRRSSRTPWRRIVWLVLVLLVVPGTAATEGQTGGVKVDSQPSGATVIMDGKTLGKTPVLAEVKPGAHRLEIKRKGYKTVKKKIKVAADKITRIDVKLKVTNKQQTKQSKKEDVRVHNTASGGKDSGPGTVTVMTAPPGLTVFIDEYYIPQPTPVAFDIRAGIYELTVEQKGEVVYRKTVFVQAGRTLDLDLVIKKTRKIDYSDPWK
jgi:uncharacterized membrane protein